MGPASFVRSMVSRAIHQAAKAIRGPSDPPPPAPLPPAPCRVRLPNGKALALVPRNRAERRAAAKFESREFGLDFQAAWGWVNAVHPPRQAPAGRGADPHGPTSRRTRERREARTLEVLRTRAFGSEG
jgi:hypothetical protein